MIIPDGTNPFFSQIALQAQRQLASSGYPMVVLNSDNSIKNEVSALDTLLSLGVSGIIFISVGDNETIYMRLKESDIPIVIMDREIPEVENCDFVISDNRIGVIDAVKYLRSLGHSDIGILKGSQNTDPGRVRYRAFLEGMDESSLTHNPRFEFDGEFDYWSGGKTAELLYSMQKDRRPSAIICSNDLMAFGLLQGLARHDIRVPDEISIIGIDDIPLCSWANPKLTTVRQETTDIASVAASLLVSRVAGDYVGDPRIEFIKPRLVKRETVKVLTHKAMTH